MTVFSLTDTVFSIYFTVVNPLTRKFQCVLKVFLGIGNLNFVIFCYGKVINFEAVKANELAAELALRLIWLFVQQQIQKCLFSTTIENNTKNIHLWLQIF